MTAAMGLLRGYYGLRSPPGPSPADGHAGGLESAAGDEAGTEMAVYKFGTGSRSDEVFKSEEDGPYSPIHRAGEEGPPRVASRWDLAEDITDDGCDRGGAAGPPPPLAVTSAAAAPSPQQQRRRRTAAEEVAAVVEELARAHRDTYVPVGVAGDVGAGRRPVSEEELTLGEERLTRRRGRGDHSTSPLRLGSSAAAGAQDAETSRGSVPSRGPAPRPKPAMAAATAAFDAARSPNGFHPQTMAAAREPQSSSGNGGDPGSDGGDGTTGDSSGGEDAMTYIRRSASSPLLQEDTKQQRTRANAALGGSGNASDSGSSSTGGSTPVRPLFRRSGSRTKDRHS
eukprot:SM000268S09728  [mRNA]  locus=s268:36832:37951:+ [translate_table: standard]